jgi:chromosome segregation ATPase
MSTNLYDSKNINPNYSINNQNINNERDIDNLPLQQPQHQQFPSSYYPNSTTNDSNLLKEISKLKKMNERVSQLEENDIKLSKLEKDVKNNEIKIDEISNNLYNITKKNNEDALNETKTQLTTQNDYEKMIQENITLKADTLIYREDIAHLCEVNKKLEFELENSRKKILDLINQNDSYEKELNYKKLQINNLNECLTRLRLFDNPEIEFQIENKKNKDQKILELNFDLKNLNEDNVRLITENKILNQRICDLEREKENLCKQINYNKCKDAEQINNLEEKIRYLENQLENISKDNTNLRLNDEKCNREINLIKKERENLNEKLDKKKNKIKSLEISLNSLQDKYNNLINEKKDNIKEINIEKEKNNNNKQIFNDLYNKIQFFKTQVKNKRNYSSTNTQDFIKKDITY